ncbi:hypothetical protein D9611_004986 [Ephemerocybe angulata]|uniref:Major facilitator superfamily (MFS) profile domain-containing protein n=1 Tax=Ephemerocybe angulata TaxID=980116 RepID=A0A8H5B3E7_9AGAR|nr:hypothetical protein D9611_004986 [Tulosesus angulatus]
MSTTSDSVSEKHSKHDDTRGPGSSAQAKFAAADIDVAAHLANTGSVKTLTHEEGQRLRRKIDWHLMPLMCILYLMTFADKTTLGQSAVLGIIPSNKLSQNQFNWLGTIFSLSFLFFEYPQNLALQRFPVGKWMSLNIFVWAVALLCHAACKSFGALFTVRFILGACEGAITPGFMIVTSMFYTREEQTRRVGYWFLMNGFAIIFLGFTSFGVLHTKTPNFKPWQWLMIITGLITLIVSLLFWLFFPDSPTNAWFLTPEERVQAIERIKVNQSGVENKRWKKDQFLETLRDPKVWIMALFAAIVNVPNSLINQRQIIVNQFGFAPIHTTLIGCVDGVVESAYSYSAWCWASRPWGTELTKNCLIFFRLAPPCGSRLLPSSPSPSLLTILPSTRCDLTHLPTQSQTPDHVLVQSHVVLRCDCDNAVLTIWLGVSLTRIPALGRGYTSILMFVPALLGSLLVNTLRDSNRVGLLFSYWVSGSGLSKTHLSYRVCGGGACPSCTVDDPPSADAEALRPSLLFFIVPFPIFLGWAGSIVSGHTKRTTTNAIILIAYALGNAAGPFMWKKEYQPRNHIPWIVISSCIFSGAVLVFVLRTLLARENARRDAETRDETYDDVYVLTEKPDGTKVETRVDKTFLDLTDLQNRDFRYIL